MKRKVLKEVKAFADKVRRSKKQSPNYPLKYGPVSSLGKVIKTQEQADRFMKLLRSL